MNDNLTATQWRGDNAPTPINPPQVFVRKDSAVISILGSFQELSAALGLARAHLVEHGLTDMNTIFRDIQRHLYIIKADFASATEDEVVAGKKIPRMSDLEVIAVDAYVQEMEERLGIKPDRFILEGGSTAAAALFLANEVSRRTERLLVTLKGSLSGEEARLEPKLDKAQQYLNHLSYLLYIAARVTNRTLGIEEESVLTDAETGEVMTFWGGKSN
jgi:ATP:cob(I)alamin adenosyltransferase